LRYYWIFLLFIFTGCGKTPVKDGHAGPSGPFRAADISVQKDFACATLWGTDRSLVCWGNDPERKAHPLFREAQQVNLGDTVEKLTSDCFINASQRIFCFGSAPWHPAKIYVDQDAIDLAKGHNHQCIVDDDHRLLCWGSNDWGQVGDGLISICEIVVDYETGLESTVCNDPTSPQTVMGIPAPIDSVAVGSAHTCAVAKGNTYCWGNPTYGAVPTLDTDPVPIPKKIPLDEAVASIESSPTGVCALSISHRVFCWGKGPHTLNPLYAKPASDIVEIVFPEPVSSIAMGDLHACAISTVGSVYCWGENRNGELGIGVPSFSISSPQRVPGISGAIRLSLGPKTSCVVSVNGAVQCWGWAVQGIIGDGTYGAPYTSRAFPVTVHGFVKPPHEGTE
jgi:hypothetical protein